MNLAARLLLLTLAYTLCSCGADVDTPVQSEPCEEDAAPPPVQLCDLKSSPTDCDAGADADETDN